MFWVLASPFRVALLKKILHVKTKLHEPKWSLLMEAPSLGFSSVPLGIRLWGTTFQYKCFPDFKIERKNILECDSGAHIGLIHNNIRGQKSHATIPLSSIEHLIQQWCSLSFSRGALSASAQKEFQLQSCSQRLILMQLQQLQSCSLNKCVMMLPSDQLVNILFIFQIPENRIANSIIWHWTFQICMQIVLLVPSIGVTSTE